MVKTRSPRQIVLLTAWTIATLCFPIGKAAANHSGDCPAGVPAPQLGNKAFPILWDSTTSTNYPNTARFVSTFNSSTHHGEDIFPLPYYSAPGSRFIAAVESGIIEGPFSQFAGNGPGWIIKVRGDDGYLYKNMHLATDPAIYGMFEGLRVVKGQIIGVAGNTGNAGGTSTHNHFEMWNTASGALQCPFRTIWSNFSVPGQVDHNTVYQHFATASARLGGGYPSGVSGVPTSNGGPTQVHDWNGVNVQDFNGGSVGPMIIVDSFFSNAGLVYGQIRDKFMSLGGTAEFGRTKNNGGGFDEHSWCAFTARSNTETKVNDFYGVGTHAPAAILWTPTHGPHNLWGGSLTRYINGGGPCAYGPAATDMMFWYSNFDPLGGGAHYGFYARDTQSGSHWWIWHNNNTSGAWCCY